MFPFYFNKKCSYESGLFVEHKITGTRSITIWHSKLFMTYELFINLKSITSISWGSDSAQEHECLGPCLQGAYNLKRSIHQPNENKNKEDGKEKGLELLMRNSCGGEKTRKGVE